MKGLWRKPKVLHSLLPVDHHGRTESFYGVVAVGLEGRPVWSLEGSLLQEWRRASESFGA